jgi:glycosyltransferase involved in cell wall biosynthesis
VATPSLSVVVVAYDMGRELPRTLRSLSPALQRGVDADDCELVLVDNGSPEPVPEQVIACFGGHVRSVRIDDATPSPARAANVGLAEARGELVGLIVDGARMASPGLLAAAVQAARVAQRPVVASLAWHLGPHRHMVAATSGWDQAAEDELLAGIDWERDGYQLFDVSTFAASSARGWFGPMGESSALFLPRELWDELGGLDERFDLPGGGLVNHDLYRRACALDGTELVVLVGEGTFHQFHGGAATSRRLTWDVMHDQYQQLRGEPYQPPARPPLYFGRVRPEILGHLRESVRLAEERAQRTRLR